MNSRYRPIMCLGFWAKKSVMMNYTKKTKIRTMEHYNQMILQQRNLSKKACRRQRKPAEDKKKVRRPPTTWIKLIGKDLSLINIQLNIESNPAEKTSQVLHEITANRKNWRRIVKDIIAEIR